MNAGPQGLRASVRLVTTYRFKAVLFQLIQDATWKQLRYIAGDLCKAAFFMMRNLSGFARILAEIRGETCKPFVQF